MILAVLFGLLAPSGDLRWFWLSCLVYLLPQVTLDDFGCPVWFTCSLRLLFYLTFHSFAPDEDYSRNMSCIVNLISTFPFVKLLIFVFRVLRHKSCLREYAPAQKLFTMICMYTKVVYYDMHLHKSCLLWYVRTQKLFTMICTCTKVVYDDTIVCVNVFLIMCYK
jgi:hypothetical protein